MQQLLEPLIHSESWAPLKIKFNWDASFWTKQISTLGEQNQRLFLIKTESMSSVMMMMNICSSEVILIQQQSDST